MTKARRPGVSTGIAVRLDEVTMIDGEYAIRFSADGYAGTGHATVAGQRFEGSDGRYAFEGTVESRGGKLKAMVRVHLAAAASPNRHLPSDFSMSMSGESTTGAFSLIGTGPLGLIVEIASFDTMQS